MTNRLHGALSGLVWSSYGYCTLGQVSIDPRYPPLLGAGCICEKPSRKATLFSGMVLTRLGLLSYKPRLSKKF